MLKITNLSVMVDEKTILSNLNLQIDSGQIHVLMGPNGSGKSSLAHTLMGFEGYKTTHGSLFFEGTDLGLLSIDKRAQAGIFLAFQNPVEIPGLTVFNFLKEVYHALTKKLVSVKEFEKLIFEVMDTLEIDRGFAYRQVHAGFSGGEKKRLEMLQLILFKPKLAILDEIDSGLDVDAIKIVARGLIHAMETNAGLSLLLITHYPRLLKYMAAHHVHVIHHGTIIKSGSAVLAAHIEREGYHAIGSE